MCLTFRQIVRNDGCSDVFVFFIATWIWLTIILSSRLCRYDIEANRIVVDILKSTITESFSGMTMFDIWNAISNGKHRSAPYLQLTIGFIVFHVTV